MTDIDALLAEYDRLTDYVTEPNHAAIGLLIMRMATALRELKAENERGNQLYGALLEGWKRLQAERELYERVAACADSFERCPLGQPGSGSWTYYRHCLVEALTALRSHQAKQKEGTT